MRVISYVLAINSILACGCSLVLNFDEKEESPLIDAGGIPTIDSSIPPLADARLPSCDSLLSFESSRVGGQDIYTAKPDGSGLTILINGLGPRNYNTRWSPDGEKLLFHTDRDGNLELYVINSDGSGTMNLSNNTASDQLAFWSPDGTKILFLSNREGNQEVYWMNADGTAVINVSSNAAVESSALWSPDGTRIFFLSDRNATGELHSAALDGTDLVNFTPLIGTANISSYSFSPDGSKIAFSRPLSSLPTIFTMNIDGSGLNQVTTTLDATSPRWISESRIVFENKASANTEIFAVNTDGTNRTNLSNSASIDRSPTVDHTTGLIAFISDRVEAGLQDVWVMDSNGAGLVNISATIGEQEGGPRWRPCQPQ